MRAWVFSVDEPVVTEGCAARLQRGPRPRLVPAEETDDGPRQVPDFADGLGFTVAGTAPDFRRLPFEPPPPSQSSWAAPWSAALLGRARMGCQIQLKPINGSP